MRREKLVGNTKVSRWDQKWVGVVENHHGLIVDGGGGVISQSEGKAEILKWARGSRDEKFHYYSSQSLIKKLRMFA